MRVFFTPILVVGLSFIGGCGKKDLPSSQPNPKKVAGPSEESKKEPTPRTQMTGKGQSLPPQPESSDIPPEAKVQREIAKVVHPFLAAFRAKDVDVAMRDVALPFAIGYELAPKTIDKADELKTEFKNRMESVKNWNEFPTKLNGAETFEQLGIDTSKVDQKGFEPFIAVASRQGYVVDLVIEQPKGLKGCSTRIYVKYIDGKPRIVGFSQNTKD